MVAGRIHSVVEWHVRSQFIVIIQDIDGRQYDLGGWTASDSDAAYKLSRVTFQVEERRHSRDITTRTHSTQTLQARKDYLRL